MADLRDLLVRLGFEDIATYLQSGNVVFTSDVKDGGVVRSLLEPAFEERFGFEVPTVVRTSAQMTTVVSECPYRLQASRDPTRVHATFIDPSPPPDVWAGIDPASVAPEEFLVGDGVVYMHVPDGLGRARLQSLIDRATRNVTATSRNWRTVLAVYQMAGGQST